MIRQVAYPYEVKTLKIFDRINIAYIDEGKGDKTLLFIHGLATYSLSWKKNIEGLKDKYRCIAIDLPGNGLSDRSEDIPYSIGFFADTIWEVINKLKLKNVCLVGHSMGGQIAITTLLKHPQSVAKLVLCAPAGFERFSSFESGLYKSSIGFLDMFSTNESSLRSTIRSSFYHNPAQADDMVNELVDIMNTYPSKQYSAMIESCIHSMLHEPVFNRLKEIKHPVLVLFGERDALIPNRLIHPITTKQVAKEGCDQLQHAKLFMLHQCGHFLQWEKAKVVNKLIDEFI